LAAKDQFTKGFIMKKLLTPILITAAAFAQTSIPVKGTLTINGTLDASTATSTSPAKKGLVAAIPATCTVGDQYFATDATAGQNLYGCTATNTWTQQAGGGGGGATITGTDAAVVVKSGSNGVTRTLVGFTNNGTTLDADGTVLAELAGDNTLTGFNDFSGATYMRLPKGTTAPSSTDCDASGEVGKIYLQSDNPATSGPQLWVCRQTGASTYAWHPSSHFVGTTAPTKCTVGQVFFDSDATAGSNWFGCTTTDNWTLLGGGSGLSDPGTNGILVRNGAGTTSARTLTAGTGITVTNGTGVSSNPTVAMTYDPIGEDYILIQDEFLSAVGTTSAGELNWVRYQNTGTCATASIDGEQGHPGIIRLTGSTTASTSCGLGLGSSSTLQSFFSLGSTGTWTAFEAKFIVRLDASDITNSRYFIGFAENSSAWISDNNHIGLRYDSAGSACTSGTITAGNLGFTVETGGSEKCVDTGVAATANVWYKLRVWSASPGNISMALSSAGGAYGTTQSFVTAEVPTAIMYPLGVAANSTGGTVIKTMDFDLFKMVMSGLSR
jgi:hypothetical protein